MFTVRAKSITIFHHFSLSAVLFVSAVSCDEPVISRPERRSNSDASSAVKIFDSYRKGSHRQTCTVNSSYYCSDEHQSCCSADFPACCPTELIGVCCTSSHPFCCADGESCCPTGFSCCPGGPYGEVSHCCSRWDTVCCGTTCCERESSTIAVGVTAMAVGVTAKAAIGWLMVILVHISIMY